MKTVSEPNFRTERALTRAKAVWLYHMSIHAFILGIVLVLAGCGTVVQSVNLPPVVEMPAGPIQDGHFVWIDLLTEDVVAAASFYSRLFGWRAAKSKENGEYYLFSLDGMPVGDMTAMESKNATAFESLWLATISVSDVNQTSATAREAGGSLVLKTGDVAVLADPTEAAFGIQAP